MQTEIMFCFDQHEDEQNAESDLCCSWGYHTIVDIILSVCETLGHICSTSVSVFRCPLNPSNLLVNWVTLYFFFFTYTSVNAWYS